MRSDASLGQLTAKPTRNYISLIWFCREPDNSSTVTDGWRQGESGITTVIQPMECDMRGIHGRKIVSGVLAASFAAAALATSPAIAGDCFYKQEVTDWKKINSQTIVVWDKSDAFRVDLRAVCSPLETAKRIGFSAQRMNRLCGAKYDRIRIGNNYCGIDSVYELDSQELASLLDQVDTAASD